MTTNPLRTRQAPAFDAVEQLQAHVDQLNNYRWVRNSGKLYYVASREKADGKIEYFVDRYI